MRHPPIRAPYYGTPLYYRIENRAGTKTLIVSYRDERMLRPKLVCEMPPIGGRKLQPYIDADTPKDELLMTLPIQIMSDILHPWIGLGSKDGPAHRKTAPDLTLGILLVADHSLLLNYTGNLRTASSIKDDERIINTLLTRFGTLPWRSVTPETCAEWLSRQSLRRKKDVKRLMSHFEELQLQAGLIDHTTWEHYQPQETSRKQPSHKSYVKNQVEPNKLTQGQCSTILAPIREKINNHTADGIDMAIILSLSCGLDLEYITALDLSDFSFLRDYRSRLTVNITRQHEKAQKNYLLREIENPYARRKLPLPIISADCYRVITASIADLHTPLVPDPRNRKHRLTPHQLRQVMTERLSTVRLIPVTDTPGVKLPSAIDALSATAFRGLLQCGLEIEELRMLRGQPPQLVSAKHYYDRTNESAINKIGAIQDRWFSSLRCGTIPQNRSSNAKLSAINAPITWVSPLPDHRTQVYLTLGIPPIPEELLDDDIILALNSLHGFSGTITIQEG